MNNRRKQILNELGLTPIWKTRTDSIPRSMASESCEIASSTMDDLSTPASETTRDHSVHSMNWDQLKLAVSSCTACALCQTRKNTVFGVGDQRPDGFAGFQQLLNQIMAQKACGSGNEVHSG